MKKITSALLCVVLMLSLACPALAVGQVPEVETAAAYLKELGILAGDQNGDLRLNDGLTRAHLATILTRLQGNPDHVQAEQAYYISQCQFSDVPEWARMYVGYCYANGLMAGYGGGAFGADDGVTPQAACTVVLRYLDLPEVTWDYSTACQTALDRGLTTNETIGKTAITRGDLAVMVYRALGSPNLEDTASEEVSSGTIIRNPDGSINTPSDGSRYVPQVGDVIRCNGGKVNLYSIRGEIVERTNELRRENGLPALAMDDNLMAAAQVRAEEAATTITYRHTRPDGSDNDTVLLHTGTLLLGENMGMKDLTGNEVSELAEIQVTSWSNSAGHYKNMLNTIYHSMGAGVAQDKYGMYYVVLLLAGGNYMVTGVDQPIVP